MNFDVKEYIRKFEESGFKRSQAELLAQSLSEIKDQDIEKLATKEQVDSLGQHVESLGQQVNSLKHSTKEQIESLGRNTKEQVVGIKSELEDFIKRESEKFATKEQLAVVKLELEKFSTKEQLAEVREQIANVARDVTIIGKSVAVLEKNNDKLEKDLEKFEIKVDKGFERLDAKIDNIYNALNAKMDREFEKFSTKDQVKTLHSDIMAQFSIFEAKMFKWILGSILAGIFSVVTMVAKFLFF